MVLILALVRVKTETTNSSAKILPNKRKLKDKGFVKSSKYIYWQ